MTTQVKIENVQGPGNIEVTVMMKVPAPVNDPGSPPDAEIEKHILVPGASLLYYAHSAQYHVVKEV